MINFIAEIGINHNGSLEITKQLIDISKDCGCQYVKIQKRNPDVCVPEHQKNVIRETPWGKMTYLEYKHKIEFNEEQIKELCDYAKNKGITFFASVWDKDSVDVMAKFTKISKIPSALITDLELCKYARDNFEFLIISTGMSTEEEIEACVKVCNPDVIMHTNSTYPCPFEEINMKYLIHLKNKYPTKELGYSGHEGGTFVSCLSIPYGATWIERHITLDKNMWGSDHKASIDPNELKELMNNIRITESVLKYEPQNRIIFESEQIKKQSLRK
jgi:N-acetylneuraminate synthase